MDRHLIAFHRPFERPIWAVFSLLQLLSVAAAVVMLTLSSTSEASAAAPPQWLHVEGNRTVNESGELVALRGVNIENWNWHWSQKRTLEYERRAIAEATGAAPEGWGANVILIAVASGPVNRNDAAYLAYVDEMVDRAKQNGAYTLIVWRSHEPNGSQPKMPDQAAEDALARLAGRYADEPAVIYGLQVEPHDVSWSQLKPRFTSMIDAVRARNPRALVVVPGTHWGRYVHWMLSDPIDRSNLVLKSHVYDRWGGIPGFRFPELAARYPVMLGEFGTGGQMDQSDVDQLLDLAESLEMSWVAWLFHEKACPCLIENANTLEPSSYGRSIRDRLQTASLAARTARTSSVSAGSGLDGSSAADSPGDG